MKHIIILAALLLSNTFYCGSNNKAVFDVKPSERLLKDRWSAYWITCPGASPYDYGVYHFRKSVSLDSKPSSFVINISADNRYRLFINGEAVCWGPSRGDISHWYYETVDVAPFMKEGKNTLAVVVWNFSPFTPGAQMTLRTALIVQGNTPEEDIVNTDATWKVFRNPAYSPSTDYLQDVGCTDAVDASLYPWGWEKADFSDDNWINAGRTGRGQPYGNGSGYNWVLCPRDIPMMEESLMRMAAIRRSEGITIPAAFLEGRSPLTIPAGKKVSFLIDQSFLTSAFPELIVSGGKNSSIKITYGEGLYKDRIKANRNEIEGKTMIGFVDKFYPDGGSDRLFRPLWFRTYRYIQMDIETKGEPLTIKDMYGLYTAYPFKENGQFESDEPLHRNVWETGWRTAKLCAHETYFDCPYYEQLQYVGDTRIQALISLYVDGDDRLMRKAIKMFDWSRSYEGITTSRHPSRTPQYIPPYSLYWINMVHDYWMHRDDRAFVKSCIPTVKTILEWFADKIDPQTGMLGAVPHWNFVDWPKEWPWNSEQPSGGVPPGGITGGSSILSLQLAYTLKDAVALLAEFGEDDLSAKYKKLYQSIRHNTWERCWDSERKLFADDLKQTSYSQQANIMGILSDAAPVAIQQELFKRLDTDPSLIQATFYYRFYLFRALKKTHLGEQYTGMLKPWYDMLDIGLTTFAEEPEPSRSDCHAWSACPLYDFLSIVCGIEPAEPGFRSVRIEPHLGILRQINGQAAHPKGIISVGLNKGEKGLTGTIVLPAGLSGVYIHDGIEKPLSPGENKIE
ncbi:MAG: alpha-L-rhamnosidase N-terminal domain-containing protein [Prevotella sp.]|jgi:hypothetical protein|nr:alpha-L-rhamnosidase N-terminal domain-containing protein [Prevotella sp.]